MMNSLKPYRECRESGLPWLGRIPEHWEVRRNARLFTERNEMGYPELPILEVSIRTGVTVRDMENQRRKQMMSDLAKYKRALRGDIAYNMMRMWQGAVGAAPVDGLISPAYVVATPFPEADSRYYAYLFRTVAYMNEVNKYSRGIVTDRNRLYWDEFRQMLSTFPPPTEQISIAKFLDNHATLVARLIRTKRRQIEVLNEQKRAVIECFVNGGPTRPTPSAQLESGAAHSGWKIFKLKHLVSFNPSKAEAEAEKAGVSTVVFLPMERVSADGKVDCSERRPVSEIWDGYTYFRRHDVVVAKITPCFENGKGAYLGDLETSFGFGTTEFVVLRASPELAPKFLYYITQADTFRQRGKEQMTGAAGQQRVPLDFMRDYLVVIPPKDEQEVIVQEIEAALVQIDVAVEVVERQIRLIREYRTRLIADVVTGQIDVREESLEPVGSMLEIATGEIIGEDSDEVPEELEEVSVGDE